MDYPERGSHFAHKAFRLMHKASVPAEIGRDAFCLVAVILHTEDAARYRGPVKFFNSQLMETLGFAKWESFDRARRKAIESGWLRYEGCGKRSAGRYCVTIPTGYERIDDEPMENPDSRLPPADGYNEGYKQGYNEGYKQGVKEGIDGGIKRGQRGVQTGDKGGEPPIPAPSPNPNPESEAVSSFSEKLDHSVKTWIAYKAENGKRYKPTGMKSLLTRVANVANSHGDDAVISLMERAMASGWQGWDHDLDKLKPKSSSKVLTVEELEIYSKTGTIPGGIE